MGWISMSERDLKRIEVLTEVLYWTKNGSCGSSGARSASGRHTVCWRGIKDGGDPKFTSSYLSAT